MTFSINFNLLKGKHVQLEPIDDSHTEGLFRAGQNYKDWCYLPIPGFHQYVDAEKWVAQAKRFLKLEEQYTYVLVEPSSGTVMGSSRYMNIRSQHAGFEVGYSWLGTEYQRSVVNTEAKLLLLANAFEAMKAQRVEFKTDLRNVRSQKAIERIGGKREGVLRKHMIAQGGYVRDSVMYSIIDSEWVDVKANLLNKLSSYE